MDMSIHALSGIPAAVLHGRQRIDRMAKLDVPGEPQVAVGQERSWSGVSVCTMEMRWPDGSACHEITRSRASLWIILEEVGGRYEHRTAPNEPLRSVRTGTHVMSLVPAGMELWGYSRGIRFVRALRITFDLEQAGLALGDRRLAPAFAEPRLMFTNDSLWQIATLLANECDKPRGIDGLYGESLATALCVELLRLGAADNRPVARGGLAPWQMRRITEYMEAHLNETIQLSDFAQLAGMSRSHFSQAFRTSTGMPPHRWHLNARIRRAQELLLDTSLPLVEIALRTGFADQSHFTKSFQRQVGTSPGAWRRSRRN